MQTNRLNTPPPVPVQGDRRLIHTGFPVESPNDYLPGGLHPVHIDDELRNGRYRVVRKLGEGSYSTVWLAFDRQLSRYVAVKIMLAKYSASASHEISIYALLAEKAKSDTNGKHIMMLVDHFEVTGPNGQHKCLVFEPMGPSAASMVEELPLNLPARPAARPHFPKETARGILKQVLLGLAFLHKSGVVHADLQHGNILFSTISNLDSIPQDELRQNESTFSTPLERKDGKTDLWAPRYLALGQPLHEHVDIESLPMVKISDFGSAFLTSSPPTSTVTPVALRAPELIFNEHPFTSAIDIWAFACLIYEFFTGVTLFAVCHMGFDEMEDTDDDHILDLIDALGEPLPDRLMEKWQRKEKWIGPNGERLQPYTASDEPGSEFDGSGEAGENFNTGPVILDPLEVRFDQYKPDDVGEAEAKEITALIRTILQIDPEKRPTAEQLLQHEWFQSISV